MLEIFESLPKNKITTAIFSVVLLTFFALAIKTYGFDIFSVPTASMQPTINIDDKILIQKCLFKPQKDDILAFHLPQNHDELFIKRCKGIPLDTVWIDTNRNYQINKKNSQILDNEFVIIPKKGLTISIDYKNLTFYKPLIERDEDGQIGIIGTQLYINGRVTNDYTFKQNYYFMVGDNTAASLDSRNFGVIAASLLLGKMIL
jgi:signal peptidase I